VAAPIHAGDLRHRVTIRALIEVADGKGGFQQAKVPVCVRTAANVEPLAGRVLVQAMQIDPRSRYSVQMRWRPDVTPRQELTYHARTGDKVFEILSVNDTEELHHEMVLTCAEAA
jgi:SPP1 family predicted phage head-tail adaptor